jgi:hypothetical protein
MKIIEADVIWTPMWSEHENACRGQIRVEKRGPAHQRTPGDLWVHAGIRSALLDPNFFALHLFILFNTITVRDGIAPMDAHNAFLQIDEYRDLISADTPGAA